MNKKELGYRYEKVLDDQRDTVRFGEAARDWTLGFLLAMLPGSFYTILSLNYLIILLLLGGFLVSFAAYIIFYVNFAKLEILEIYYITLIKRKNYGRTTKRSTKKI